MSEIAIVFFIIGAMIGLFVWDRLPVPVVCLAASLALWASGLLDLRESLAGFGDPAVVFVAALFVVGAGMEAVGLTAWMGQVLIARAGDSRPRLVIWMMVLCGGLGALITINGAVAALLPVVVVLAIRLGRSPGKLLMPLVFGAHAGSMLLLTGTPVNVLVAEASANAGAGGVGYFEFALVGVPLLIGTVVIAVLFGDRLLPDRTGRNLPPDLSRHVTTLVEHYRLRGALTHLRVREGSALVGEVASAGLVETEEDGARFVLALRSDGSPRREPLAAGDWIVVNGPPEAVAALAARLSLAVSEEAGRPAVEDTLLNRDAGLAEVVIPPRSALVGERVSPGMTTPSGDLVVLACHRGGVPLAPLTEIAPGDTVLLRGTWQALERRLAAPGVLVVDSPELLRRQAVAMGLGAWEMVAILGIMVVLLASGAVPPAVAGLLAAGAVVLLGILDMDAAYRAINWTTVILMGALMPLATAMERSGAAHLLADWIVQTLGGFGPRALIAGLFVLTALLGQVISNTATAVIVIPIAVSAAAGMGVSPQPFLMSVGVAAAAAFLTPVSTAVNLMVMEPGGYRFGDYWKLGLPMMLWFFVVAVALTPLIWRF